MDFAIYVLLGVRIQQPSITLHWSFHKDFEISESHWRNIIHFMTWLGYRNFVGHFKQLLIKFGFFHIKKDTQEYSTYFCNNFTLSVVSDIKENNLVFMHKSCFPRSTNLPSNTVQFATEERTYYKKVNCVVCSPSEDGEEKVHHWQVSRHARLIFRSAGWTHWQNLLLWG